MVNLFEFFLNLSFFFLARTKKSRTSYSKILRSILFDILSKVYFVYTSKQSEVISLDLFLFLFMKLLILLVSLFHFRLLLLLFMRIDGFGWLLPIIFLYVFAYPVVILSRQPNVILSNDQFFFHIGVSFEHIVVGFLSELFEFVNLLCSNQI